MKMHTQASGMLRAENQQTYALTIDSTGQVLVDGQLAHLVFQTATQLALVTPTAVIHCTTSAFWTACTGTASLPTIEEIGYWFAQALLRQEHLVAWRLRSETMIQQLTEGLTPALPPLTLPRPRLEPFLEECLAHCDEHPSLAQVQALATLLRQPVQTVIAWLEERGKHVIVLRSEKGASAEEGDHEQAQDVPSDITVPDAPKQTEDVPAVEGAVQTEAATVQAPTRRVSACSKPGQFKWTDERTAQLRASFLALPVSAQSSRRAAAMTIARQQHWPLPSVLYKLYALYPLPTDEAEPGIEVLVRGAVLWDVHVTCDGQATQHERWELAYALGNFPYAPQTHVKYRGQRYEVQQVHSNLLLMRPREQAAMVPEAETPPARQDLMEPVGV